MKKANHKSLVHHAGRTDNRAVCELCQRKVSFVSRHHIIPKSEGGTDTVDLCTPCHATLHKFFSNRTLANTYSSIEAIRADPTMQRYLNWVRKQPDRHIRVRTRKDRT